MAEQKENPRKNVKHIVLTNVFFNCVTTSSLRRSNCHLYHYAGNNPVRYVDLLGLDDVFYDVNGLYVKSEKAETNNVYYQRPTGINSGKFITEDILIGTQDMFDEYVGTVYGEGSDNRMELFAIANVIKNQADYSGKTIHEIFQEGKIYGYTNGNIGFAKTRATINSNTKLNVSRQAVVNALRNGRDYSNGSYFWEGLTFITSDSKNFNPGNWYVKQGWGTNRGTVSKRINYCEVIRYGGTVFMINNPEYRKVCYP